MVKDEIEMQQKMRHDKPSITCIEIDALKAYGSAGVGLRLEEKLNLLVDESAEIS